MSQWWGCPPVVLLDLLATEEYGQLMSECLEGNCSDSAQLDSSGSIQELQEHMNNTAVSVFFGTGQTNGGWEKQRRIQGFESRSVAADRTKAITKRRGVPAVLAQNEVLCAHLIECVQEMYGSGAALGKGQEFGWKHVNEKVAELFYKEDAEIFAWLSNANNATHTKSLYLQQLTLSEAAVACIDAAISPYELEKVRWNILVTQLVQKGLIEELLDLEYLVRESYCILRGFHKTIRRKRKRLTTGQLLPVPPPAAEIRALGKAMLFREDSNNELTEPQFLQYLENPHWIYGGKELTTTKSVTNGKKRMEIAGSASIRAFNPRLQLIRQVKTLVDEGILHPKESPVKLFFCEHGDASPVLTWYSLYSKCNFSSGYFSLIHCVIYAIGRSSFSVLACSVRPQPSTVTAILQK